jgi:excisionase family DNA binding protein
MDALPLRLLTVKETADWLGCSEANVYSLLEKGELPYVSVGRRKGYRIDPTDIAEFIRRRKAWNQPAQPHLPRPRLKHLRLPGRD